MGRGGFDLAQLTFVRGKTGWIAFDPLTALETARAAKELLDEHVEELPVVAVVYSHSHGDHFGGVRGLVDIEDVRAGKVEIIAPRDFMDFAVAENIYAGNAMNRRLFFQYGVLLPASPYGHAGQGLGQNVAQGNVGLIAPTRVVDDAVETFEVDGVEMIFQNTPDTEAPSEMNTYIPSMKTLWMAENLVASVHNIYTLRGAMVRDALRWSKYINEALFAFGKEAEVMIASHHWPRWGNDRIQEVMKAQRDIYAHQHNQVLHYANQGVTINQIHNIGCALVQSDIVHHDDDFGFVRIEFCRNCVAQPGGQALGTCALERGQIGGHGAHQFQRRQSSHFFCRLLS